MKDKQRRISAKQFQLAETTIKNRLRGEKFRLYKRVTCQTGVYVSGNEVRAADESGWPAGPGPTAYRSSVAATGLLADIDLWPFLAVTE